MKGANGDYFIYCVSLVYSGHWSLLRRSELNLSCIVGVGVLAVSPVFTLNCPHHFCCQLRTRLKHVLAQRIQNTASTFLGRNRKDGDGEKPVLHLFPNFVRSWPVGQHNFSWLLAYTGREARHDHFSVYWGRGKWPRITEGHTFLCLSPVQVVHHILLHCNFQI